MELLLNTRFSLCLMFLLGPCPILGAESYRWAHAQDSQPLEKRFAPPVGTHRLAVPKGSFGSWLRQLPIKAGHPDVLLYNGRPKGNQGAHAAVVDIDVGGEDLQQCADAVIRLRAEYQRSSGRDRDICFRFTSGDPARWEEWRSGKRPLVLRNFVRWVQRKPADDSGANFRAYLTSLYRWAGSASLSRELRKVPDPRRVEPGDVFIHGGFPGHAVLVVDVVEDVRGHRQFMIAQSYMPAQDIQILYNPASPKQPWYDAEEAGELRTPEWTFARDELKRFLDQGCPTAEPQ